LQEDGNYTTTLRLIDDLNLKEVLGHTGSKTLFVADDQAYAEWYKNNSWGVSSYDQLSDAQKRLLLNNSMVNNAYLIELMSNAYLNDALQTGRAMRRETASGIYDSVYVMKPEEMPNTPAWAYYKANNKSIPIFRDESSAPMIHFLPAYMSYNKITSEDLSIMTNGQATSANEAWVNGKKVEERDITCKNGYIQKMSGVIESSPNMAQIVHMYPQLSKWAELIDRYSAPYYAGDNLKEGYNGVYHNEDSVFTLHYFSERSTGGNSRDRLPNGDPVPATLKFDPGWNQYSVSISGYDLHHDAAAMIVPTNEALEKWWNGDGKDLHDEYKVWDSIPDATLAKLINVNMLPTFTESVPSKFKFVLNDAKETLGISKENVKACYMGCNGVIYQVDSVFTPAEFASVVYPATSHQSTMGIIYWGIDSRTFLPYLLSMDSKYALVLPNNDAMMYYLDPFTYGSEAMNADSVRCEAPQMLEFRWDEKKTPHVQARRFDVFVDKDGYITKQQPDAKGIDLTNRDIINRLFDDMLDQFIIVIANKSMTLDDYVKQGYSYFKTKGGSLLRVTKPDANSPHLAFQGGWQIEHNRKEVSTEEFTKVNGRTYILNTQMPLSAQKTLYLTLKEHEEYAGFLSLLKNSYVNLTKTAISASIKAGDHKGSSENFSLFDNYNYTVYIPTNESVAKIQDLTEDGHSGKNAILPSWSELEMGDENDEVIDSICRAEGWYESNPNRATVLTNVKAAMKTIVTDFIRYHVHDNSVAIGMAHDPSKDSKFESMKRNLETGRFYPITVKYDTKNMTVIDNAGNERHVITTNPALYNNVVREYWFEGKDRTARLFMGSGAVVHLIDGPLEYEKMRPWRDVVKEAIFN
jgi:hypothetical protein